MNSPLRMTSLPPKLVRHLQIGSGASDAGARVLVAVCVVYVCHVPCGGGVSGRESKNRKGKNRELAARKPFFYPALIIYPMTHNFWSMRIRTQRAIAISMHR